MDDYRAEWREIKDEIEARPITEPLPPDLLRRAIAVSRAATAANDTEVIDWMIANQLPAGHA